MELKATLGYPARPFLKNKQTNKKKRFPFPSFFVFFKGHGQIFAILKLNTSSILLQTHTVLQLTLNASNLLAFAMGTTCQKVSSSNKHHKKEQSLPTTTYEYKKTPHPPNSF
jgi:hypothetical protein